MDTNRPLSTNYANQGSWQDMRRAYDQLEAADRRIRELERELERLKGAGKGQGTTAATATESSITKIAGLPVSGLPAHGQKLTYNANTGQLEWS